MLHVAAAPGEVNHMRIAFDPAARAWTVRDTGTPPTAGDYCTVAGDTPPVRYRLATACPRSTGRSTSATVTTSST